MLRFLSFVCFVVVAGLSGYQLYLLHNPQDNTYHCEPYKYDIDSKECTFGAPIDTALVLDEYEPGLLQGYRHSVCSMTFVTLDKRTGIVTRQSEWSDSGCEVEPTVKAKMYEAK